MAQLLNKNDPSLMLLNILNDASNAVRNNNLPIKNPLNCCLFIHSLLVYTIDVFKQIWGRPKFKILRNFIRKPTLFYHIESHFSTLEWIECLEIILQSAGASKLVQRCNLDYGTYNHGGFFLGLFRAFIAKEVRKNDRVKIIKKFLNLGINLTSHDANYALELFGFNEELEIIIYNTNKAIPINYGYRFILPTFIFGWTDNFEQENIFKALKKLITTEAYVTLTSKENYIILSLRYFSMSNDNKNKIKVLSQQYLDNYQIIFDTLDSVPVLPSLKELCRNFLYKYIKGKKNFSLVYELHDKFKSFDTTRDVIDIIRFKKPIY